MQKPTLTLIAASSLLAVFAAQAQKGAAYQAPAQEPEFARFSLTGGATYLLPTMNGLNYASELNFNDDMLTGTALSINRDYNWGYYLAAGYMISDRYDVQANWAQSDATNDDFATPCADCDLTSSNGIFVDGFTASAQETLNYQVFNGNLGQYHKLGENLMTRVFAGIRYAKITNDTINDYFFDGVLDFSDTYNSSFSGWGPELGFDLDYQVYDWFSIVGHFTGAFLIGELDSNGGVAVDSIVAPLQIGTNSNNIQIVPAFDAQLGLSLSIPFWNEDDRFTLETGYQVDYYFDVVNQIETTTSDALVNNYVNVGLMGPYANLSVKF